jgi:hypothetical protein
MLPDPTIASFPLLVTRLAKVKKVKQSLYTPLLNPTEGIYALMWWGLRA